MIDRELIHLNTGDLVSADARIIDSTELSVDEAALTGESLPVTKQADIVKEEAALGDRYNMIFKGTAVTNGKGKAVVLSIGMDTDQHRKRIADNYYSGIKRIHQKYGLPFITEMRANAYPLLPIVEVIASSLSYRICNYSRTLKNQEFWSISKPGRLAKRTVWQSALFN